MIGGGVRLQMMLGTVPRPAPFDVVSALADVVVRNGSDGQDGFQLRFQATRGRGDDFEIVAGSALDPQTRVILAVFIGVLPAVVMDGIVTHHQLVPGSQPGQSTLIVTGLDVSQKLDLEEKNVTHPNQPDSMIVQKIVASHGLVPEVEPTTNVPTELRRVPSQHDTDLHYVLRLAQRNGFVFYVEPTLVPGITKAVWGRERRDGIPQSALNVNMGSFTNVEQIRFAFDALAPQRPSVTIIEPLTKMPIRIPMPSLLNPSLSSRPAPALRQTVVRDAAGLDPIDAALRALQSSSGNGNAATASGTLDVVRYGRVLRARRPVGLRGAGRSHDGVYYVKQVTHRIKRGEYKQDFELTREGLGATGTTLAP